MNRKKSLPARKKEHHEKKSKVTLNPDSTRKHPGEKPEDLHTDHDFHHKQPFKDPRE